MPEMTPDQARDHVELIDRILASSSGRLRPGGEFFVLWGLFSALISIGFQLVRDGSLPPDALWALLPLFVACVAVSTWRGRVLGRECGRLPAIQREFFIVLWIAIGMAWLTDLVAFRLFAGWAQSAIWTVAGAIVLAYIATHGNRRALAGCVILVASLAAANVWGGYAGFILGGGMALGYGGFGLVEMLAGA